MKCILIVDDEETFLWSAAIGFQAYRRHFDVMTAENGRAALDILEKTPVDLVVTDLKMPEMDGMTLIGRIRDNLPYIPVIVLTAFSTPRLRKKLLSLGAPAVLDKPVSFDLLRRRIQEMLKKCPGRRLRGNVSLTDGLKLQEVEKRTCSLEVRCKDRGTGYFYFQDGRLCEAAVDNRTGNPAVREMIGWNRVRITVNDFPAMEFKPGITRSLDYFIGEAARPATDSDRV